MSKRHKCGVDIITEVVLNRFIKDNFTNDVCTSCGTVVCPCKLFNLHETSCARCIAIQFRAFAVIESVEETKRCAGLPVVNILSSISWRSYFIKVLVYPSE